MQSDLLFYFSARHHQHEFDNEQNLTPGGLGYNRPWVYSKAFHPGRYLQGGKGEATYGQQRRRFPGPFGQANRDSFLPQTESYVPAKPKVISIIRNGPKPRSNVKILLNRRSVQSFEQLMGDISEAFGSKWKGDKVRKLFTLRGREVQGVADFFREDEVFVAVGNEPLSERHVLDIIEDVYPDSPYAKNIMRDFEKQKKKRMQMVTQAKDHEADKRDSGFGEGSDGSNKDPDQELVLYKGRMQDKGKRRNEYPRDLEVGMRLDREKEKAAQDEKDRARRQKQKMIESERRAIEDENRRKRQVPKGPVEDPFRKIKEQKEKDREEIRRRREEEKKKQEEEERQRREKDRHDREQAEMAARERQAAAEKAKAEKEKERAERKAREREQREKEQELAKEKEKEEEQRNRENEKDNKDRENMDEKHDKDDKAKDSDKDKDSDDKNDNRVKIESVGKDNKDADRERRKKKSKSKIVRKTKLERQISSDDYVLQKYELGRTLGDGNFAIVRIGKMKATGVEYAMKVIDKPKLKGKEHMVENEIEIMKDCNHPNIVKLYEEYETADKIYLVMELVKVRFLPPFFIFILLYFYYSN